MKYKWRVFMIFVAVSCFFLRKTEAIHIGMLGDTIERSQGENSTGISGSLRISPFGTEEKVQTFLAATRYEIVGRQYQITEKSIVQILSNIAGLGKTVALIVENETYGGSQKEFEGFVKKTRAAGVAVQSDEALGTVYNHTKTLVVDRSHILISTANLSYPSFWRNREYRVAATHTGIAQNLYDLFQKDRRAEPLEYMDIHPAVLVCPINCREKIMYALANAEKSIAIEAQYLEDEALIALLSEKIKTTDVRIIVGEYQNIDLLGELTSVTKILKEPYLHAKNILIDDEHLIVGSMNLSWNALDNNREIGIELTEKSFILPFDRQFEKDRKEAEFVYNAVFQ